MKKLLIFIVLLAVSVLGYFAYQRWFAPETTSPWLFVPSKASLVFENANPFTTLDSIQNRGVWSAFNGLEGSIKLESKLTFLDSIHDESLSKIFSQSQSIIAVFPTSAVDMDALIILRINSSEQRQALQKIMESLRDAGNRSKRRQYNGFTIEEVYGANGQVFSMVRQNDLVVCSFTPFLVEDGIRAFNDPNQLGFAANYQDAFQLTALSQDDGNVYLNLMEFSALLEIFQSDGMETISGSGLVDVEFFDRHLKFSGFTLPSDGILSCFKTGPSGLNLLDVVPNNTAILQHYSMENVSNWRDRLMEIDVTISEATKEIQSKYDVDADYLANLLGGEFGNVQLEMLGSKTPDRLLLFALKDVNQTMEFLNQTAQRMTKDSVFQDRVGDYVIGKLNDPDFTKALFGFRSELKDECYYMVYQSNLIFSNSIGEIKKLITSITEDNTWKKSVRIGQLLDLSSQDANLSLIVNVPRSWKFLMSSLNPEWAEVVQQNEVGFKSLEYLGLQFNLIDDKFYTTAVAYQPQPPKQPARSSISDKASFSSKIITKPFVVRSHVNQSLEVLVQDSSLTLYHLSNTLEILWAERLQEKIIGAIEPVDFYNNGKKQYAFVTGKQLHIIDRTGASIDGYPKLLPTIRCNDFSVVDYDGSKNYRFLISDESGSVFLIDKTGKSLEGWNPNRFESNQIVPPAHIRAAGKDAFVTIQSKSVDLRTRKGTSYPGFPITFEEDLVPNRFVEPTGSFGTSTMTVLTEGGELVRINFDGQVEHREQLYKPELNVSFNLVPDVLNNAFLITRSTTDAWEVLDAGGLKLFEKPYLNPDNSELQFYRFGGDKALLMVTNKEDDFLTVYDLEGKVLTQRPMKASNQASVIYYENQNAYQFYLSYGNTLNKVRVD